MLIIRGNRTIGLTEKQVLSGSGRNTGEPPLPIFEGRRLRTHYLRIEAGDSIGGSTRHVKFDVGYAELHRAETLLGRIQSETVAPRASRLNVAVAFMTFEPSTGER